MGWVKFSYSVRFHHIKWSYLNNLVRHVLVSIHGRWLYFRTLVCSIADRIILMLLNRSNAKNKIFKHIQSNKIKNRNNVSWVVFQLSVELLVILIYVPAVHIQSILFGFCNLFQLFNVEWFLKVSIIWVGRIICSKIHIVIIIIDHKCG